MKQKPVHHTLGAAFLSTCKAIPNTVGFRYKNSGEWLPVTFGEQLEVVRNLSMGLMDHGIVPGNHIAVMANTSIEWGRIEFASMGAGAKIIPIYPTNTPEDVEYILNHADVKYAFCDSMQALEKIISVWKNCSELKTVFIHFDLDTKKILGNYAGQVFTLNEIIHWGVNSKKNFSRIFEENLLSQKPDDIYTICYTSGTTGIPKGAMIAHRNMMSALNDTQVVMENYIKPGDESLSFLPMSHIFGRFESYTPYVLGVVQNFAENIDMIVSNLQEVKPYIFMSVPRIFEKAYTRIMEMIQNESSAKRYIFQQAMDVGLKWLQAKRKGNIPLLLNAEYKLAYKLVFKKIQQRFGGRLGITVSGGAPLSNEIQDFMEIVGVKIYQGYGLTETCAPICLNAPHQYKPGTVGKLYPDVSVRIAEDGEILVRSEKIFCGYYKNPEATKEALRDGWFYTGDIGFLDDEGYLKITDRKKDLIKTAGGKFVVPQRIENVAKTSKYINQIVVYGDGKPYITALITLHQEAIIKYAKEKKILSSNFSELVKNTDIEKLIKVAVEDLNECLPKWETVKRYYVIPNEFTVESGELTPSLKVKRKLLTQKYLNVLENLYQ